MADQINLPELTLNDGTVIPAGWHETDISAIEAVYAVEGNKLLIKDHGSMTGSVDNDILVEAPEHFEIKNQGFTGEVLLKDISQPLEFRDNVLVNAETN